MYEKTVLSVYPLAWILQTVSKSLKFAIFTACNIFNIITYFASGYIFYFLPADSVFFATSKKNQTRLKVNKSAVLQFFCELYVYCPVYNCRAQHCQNNKQSIKCNVQVSERKDRFIFRFNQLTPAEQNNLLHKIDFKTYFSKKIIKSVFYINFSHKNYYK